MKELNRRSSMIMKVVVSVFTVIFCMSLSSYIGGSVKVYAAGSTEAFQTELKNMILSGDQTTHDVSAYKIRGSQAYSAWNTLTKGDCKLAYECYPSGTFLNTDTDSQGYVTRMSIYGADSGFTSRYTKAQETIADIMSGVTANMTQADKALYLHDQLMNRVSYAKNNDCCFTAGGALGTGKAACEGYSLAYDLLLDQVGISHVDISSKTMNHMWNCIQIDGNWYNVDVTWDDGNSQKSAANAHAYFLLNDQEMKNNNHRDWYISIAEEQVTSTSTTFSDSLLHSAKGNMYYSDGKWYYASGNDIISSNADGSDKTVILSGTSNVTLNSFTDRVLSYTSDGKQSTVSAVVPLIQESKAVVMATVPANYYLVKEGGSRTNYASTNYYSLGAGTIQKALTIKDDNEAITANLGVIPDFSKYVSSSQKIVWYSIKKEGDGWHVDGEIVKSTDNSGTTELSKDVTESAATTASFYLVKEGGSRTNYSSSNYYSLGHGSILKAVSIKNDDDAISANLGSVPDYSKYVSSAQKIEWYSIKKESDGWHVDGQIISDTDNTAAVADSASIAKQNQETSAAFYLMKKGGSKTNYSGSNYYSLGMGTIIQATASKNTDVIASNLGKVPDVSEYVTSTQKVVWYSIKKEGDGWHVDGEIIDVEQPDAVSATANSITVAGNAASLASSQNAAVQENAGNAASSSSQTEQSLQVTAESLSGGEQTVTSDVSNTESASDNTEGKEE